MSPTTCLKWSTDTTTCLTWNADTTTCLTWNAGPTTSIQCNTGLAPAKWSALLQLLLFKQYIVESINYIIVINC